MRLRIPSFSLLLALTACAANNTPPDPGLPAEIRAFSERAVSLGSVIDIYGEELPAPEEGRITVVLEGEYRTVVGATEPVSLEIPVRRTEAGALRWDGFGPYAIPFSSTGDQLGTFVGTARIRLLTPEGDLREARSATDVELEVLPSILVRGLEPRMASCSSPALRAIGGLPYRLEVEALGFEPSSFTYTISAPSLGLSDAVRRVPAGRTDTIGEDGSLVLPEVPEGAQAYGMIFSIEGRARDGSTHQSLFAIAVHRPMEVYYDGNVEIAEVYAPVPVSGCIPGGDTGRRVTYTETESETRTKSYGVHWDESWLRSHTVSHSESTTDTRTESNSVGFSTTNGQSFNWSVGTEVEGSVGIEGLLSAGMKVSASVGGSRFSSQTSSREHTVSNSHSETTTDTESTTEGTGGSEGEDFRWEVSSSEQLSRDFGADVIAGTYGVFYRQTLRMKRRAALVTYNLCGMADVVGDVELEDWTWSADMGLGRACPPLPQSNLPTAQCLLPPCSGE